MKEATSPMTRKKPIIISAAVAVLLALSGGAYAYDAALTSSACATATKEHAQALGDVRGALKDARTAIGDADALQGFNDSDVNLQALRGLTDTKAGDMEECSSRAQAKDIGGDSSRLQEATAALVSHTRSLNDSLASFRLSQATDHHTAARNQLKTVVDSGQGVWKSSEGQVADDAVRQELAAALKEASGVLDKKIDSSSLEALTSHGEALVAAKKKLEPLVGKVNDAVAAKKAADEAAQKEREAAARRAAERSSSSRRSQSSGVQGSTSGGSSSRRESAQSSGSVPRERSTSKKSSGAQPAPQPAPQKVEKAPKKQVPEDTRPPKDVPDPVFHDTYGPEGPPPGCWKSSFGTIDGRDCTGDEIWP